MDSKEYYKNLLSILQEAGAGDPMKRDVEETPVGYSGEGLDDPALDPQPPIENPNDYESAIADENMEGLDDASYMVPSNIDPTIDDITERQRNTKLFDCFSELQKRIEYLSESLDSRVSLDLLDNKQLEIVSFAKERLITLKEKLINYQQNSFITRRYEENVYMFMLLRSEFLVLIKYIRKTLKLNSVEKNKK